MNNYTEKGLVFQEDFRSLEAIKKNGETIYGSPEIVAYP